MPARPGLASHRVSGIHSQEVMTAPKAAEDSIRVTCVNGRQESTILGKRLDDKVHECKATRHWRAWDEFNIDFSAGGAGSRRLARAGAKGCCRSDLFSCRYPSSVVR